MKKSRSETVDTRKRILSAAGRLFLQHGVAETGIASIMAAAGLTQGGFYRHFRSKEQLVAEANMAANERVFGQIVAAVDGKPAAEALDTAVTMYLSQLERQECEGMCPLPNLGSELRRADPAVRQAAMAGYQRLVHFFSALGQRAGAPDPDKLAGAIVTTMVGAVMLARLAAGPESARSILLNARLAIQAMIPGTRPSAPGKKSLE
jgi:TetR/AcrR family transcriptional repressor of nem operon